MSVLCSGHFNILHAGHIRMFEFACQYGQLVVGINGDYRNGLKYGDSAVPAEQREYVIRSNRFVSDVYIFDEPEPSELIRRLKPKVFVRGADYRGVRLPEQEALHEVGCELVITPFEKEFSSTKLLQSRS